MDQEFEERKREEVRRLGGSERFRALSAEWFLESARLRYSYHFTWLGRPVIQYPQDLVALQEIIWRTRPDFILETGIAHGGELVFHASLLELLGGDGVVCGIDVQIRPHNRAAIEAHPLFRRIRLIEGSSTDPRVVGEVRRLAAGKERILVVLDSNHTRAHVAAEIAAYAPLVRTGSYLVVLDTVIETLPKDLYPDRPWGPGDNPQVAVRDFLATTDRFEVDAEYASKLGITVAPGGYLRCVKD